MARDWMINGETMVLVKGGEHLSGFVVGKRSELGLSSDGIRISPRFIHRDFKTDDFGPDIPPDVMWMLGDVSISMNLYHFDFGVLDACTQESMAGGAYTNTAGTCSAAGTPLGKGLPMFASGNNLISLNILSEQALTPWRFLSCYLMAPPYEFPLGVKASAVSLCWRAIPYAPIFDFTSTSTLVAGGSELEEIGTLGFPNSFREVQSSGAVIWDRTLDT